jgi:hypothetical protein
MGESDRAKFERLIILKSAVKVQLKETTERY